METKLKRGQNVSEACRALRRTTTRRTRRRYRHGVTIVVESGGKPVGRNEEGIFQGKAQPVANLDRGPNNAAECVAMTTITTFFRGFTLPALFFILVHNNFHLLRYETTGDWQRGFIDHLECTFLFASWQIQFRGYVTGSKQLPVRPSNSKELLQSTGASPTMLWLRHYPPPDQLSIIETSNPHFQIYPSTRRKSTSD